MSTSALGSIAFIIDERISNEKRAILVRSINALRQFAKVDLFNGGITQEELLQKMGATIYSLVLLPWDRYFAWTRIEGFYGLGRTSGPTIAGYFCDEVRANEIKTWSDFQRSILLDFGGLESTEISLLVRSLIQDSRRTGIRALLDPNATVYCESWYAEQGLGARLDALLGLPELRGPEWQSRSNAMRLTLVALWAMIYEDGPGKSEFARAISAGTPRAYFQAAGDSRFVLFRLCYSMAPWSPKEAVAAFRPGASHPSSSAQILLAYPDFLRVHTFSETTDVEIVAGFSQSSPAEKSAGTLHSIWVEPMTPNLVTEIPYEAPNPNAPHLKAFPVPAGGDFKPRLAEEPTSNKAKDRFIFEAAVKIRELKSLIAEREQIIRELRSGGVGTSQPLPPPDAEGLLDAFQERYFEARYQIRQFELQIADLEKGGGSAEDVEGLRTKMLALAARERTWIKKLSATLETFKKSS